MPQRLQTLVLPGGRPRELPVITHEARRRGPTAVITANIHGDEITGLGAIHALLPRLQDALIRGRVHLYPTLNPEGLAARTRGLPSEEVDLNRSFPGDSRGDAGEQIAWALWSDIAQRSPELLIDLHADAPRSIPYALLDRATSLRGEDRRRLEQRCQRLGLATGLTPLWEYPDARYLSYRLDRSLSGAALNHLQIPALTIEAGPRLYLDADAVETTAAAVMGILSAVGMVDAPAPPHASRVEGGPWRRAPGPRVAHSGVVHFLVEPGASVVRGQPIAEIRNLAGRPIETARATFDRGIVIALPERAWARAGGLLGTFGILDR